MDDNHRNIIRSRLSQLVASVDDFDSLLEWSVESALFTEAMIEDFKVPSVSEKERINQYFMAVTKRGPAAFRKLEACLHRSRNLGTVEILAAAPGDVADSRNLCSQTNTFTELTSDAPVGEIVIRSANNINGRLGNAKIAYKMDSKPRGLALVFVNDEFDDSDVYKMREGAGEDLRLITGLFTALGYKISSHRNQTKKEMEKIIKEFSCEPELDSVDSLVVAVSSHGEIDGIVCKDCKRLNVEKDLVNPFNNENCPLLKTKPKMFFIQACRGDEHDGGVALDIADSKSYPPSAKKEAAPKVYLPTVTDILIFYATQSGNIAFLNQKHGSWFFSSIARVFMENAHRDDLQRMLNEVCRRLNQLRATQDGEKQSGEIRLKGWEKELYFNPGL